MHILYIGLAAATAWAVVFASLAGFVAKEKGYSQDNWALLGVLTGPAALWALAALPSKR